MDLDLLVKGWLGMLEEPPEEERVAAYTATREGRSVARQLGLLADTGRSARRRLSVVTLSVEDLAVASQLGVEPDDLLEEEVA